MFDDDPLASVKKWTVKKKVKWKWNAPQQLDRIVKAIDQALRRLDLQLIAQGLIADLPCDLVVRIDKLNNNE